jgi:general secretion pathway protein D
MNQGLSELKVSKREGVVMINSGKMRRVVAIGVVFLIVSPLSVFGDKKDKDNSSSRAKKYFKLGMIYEQNKQWDHAAEEFALAVAEVPSDVEYNLHLHVAMVNAAMMLSSRGDMLAEQKDYNAAFQSYRQAYSFDPTDEVSLVKMRRMLKAQGLPIDIVPGEGGSPSSGGAGARMETSLKSGGPSAQPIPTTIENLEQKVADGYVRKRYPASDLVLHSMSLTGAIENLAHTMRLNVVFDQNAAQLLARNNTYSIELYDVTPAKALEIILATNGLIYTQADVRTIIVAPDSPNSRQKYENQAVRTFYIKNATLDEVKQALQQTIGMKQVVSYKELNALVARDTPENLALADSVIQSLDKSKAEVLIDVNLYEVSKTDMLQLGNQFATGTPSTTGGAATLGTNFIGGVGAQTALQALGVVNTVTGQLSTRLLKGPFGIGLALPPSSLSLLADHGKTKLLAATQVHVLDGEQQEIKIGQRVPVVTASIPGLSSGALTSGIGTTGTTGTTTGTTGTTTGTTGTTTSAISPLGLTGFPEVQYENVGLNMDVTPTVFGQEVQIKMKLDSSSVVNAGSPTPTFNQRAIQSVARIRDSQTTMIAAVSQINDDQDIQGIPFLSYLPLIGRLFATPTQNKTTDYVVITATPHILRQADIDEKDQLTRYAGPDSNQGKRQVTLEEILYMADHTVSEQVPVAGDAEGPPKLTASKDGNPVKDSPQKANVVLASGGAGPPQPPRGPVSSGVVQTKPLANAAAGAAAKPGAAASDDDDDDDDSNKTIQVVVKAAPVAQRGQQFVAVVLVNGQADLSGATVLMTYDPTIFEVTGVRDAGMMSAGGVEVSPQTSIQSGAVSIEMDRPAGAAPVPARGQLVFVMFNVKAAGTTTIGLGAQTSFRSGSGATLQLNLQPAAVQAR